MGVPENVLPRLCAAVLVLTCVGCGGLSRRGKGTSDMPTPVLQLRLVLSEPGNQSVRAIFGAETLNLAAEPILSDSDFTIVRTIGVSDQAGPRSFTLRIECVPEADDRMRSISGQHVNERIAILFDDCPISASRAKRGRLLGRYGARVANEMEAERIVERVRNRWPEG